MKILFKIITKSILICFILLLSSCEKDLYENHLKEEKKASFQFKKVSLGEIPNIKNIVIKKFGPNLQIKKPNLFDKTEVNGITILEDSINEYIEDNGDKSYSFQAYDENSLYERYNYIIEEKNGIIKSLLLKYTPDQEWLSNNNGKFYIDSFTGKYEILDDEGLVVFEQYMKAGDLIPCPPTGSGSNVGSGGSGGTTSGGGSGGGSWVCTCCGEATTLHYELGICDKVPIYVSYVSKVTTAAPPCVNVYNPYPNDDGVSIAANVPTVIPFLLLYKTNFILNLAQDKQIFILTHHPLNQSIMNYLSQNTTNNIIDSTALDFANHIVPQAMTAPDIFISIQPFLIEKQIDDTQLDPCAKEVFQHIKNTTNCDFSQVFAKLGANGSIYNTTLKTDHNNYVDSYGNSQLVTSPANTVRTTPNIKYGYTMYVNPDYSAKTKLFIAAFLLHEMAHAYFFSLTDDFNIGANNSFNELPILFNAAVTKKFPINTEIHHQEIANSYTSAINAALQEYQPGLDQQVYHDMAWGGLIGTAIFNVNFPVGDPNRERIINRYASEQTGNSQGQGTTQQNPVGQPCN